MKASWIVTGVAVAALGLLVNQANAAPFRVGVELASGQTGLVTTAGDTVTMHVYAYMSGTDPNPANDGVQGLYGGILVGNTLAGSLAFTMDNAFTAGVHSNGTPQSDGGIYGTDPSVATGWIALNSGASSAQVVYTNTDPNKVFLGTLVFTTGPTPVIGETASIQWEFRNKTGVTGASIYQYTLDGTYLSKSLSGAGLPIGLSGNAVTISTPEPATMAILAVGGLGVLLRRRRTA